MCASTARCADVRLIVLGASRGGSQALQAVLQALPAGFAAAIAVVQHRRTGSDARLAQVLQSGCALEVREAEDKDALVPGCVILAPSDYHMLVEPGRVALSTDAPVHFARPSIDVLFESAADAYGPAVLGVVLTGGNRDGARGARAIRRCGGCVVVQEPASAAAPAMPAAAIAAGAVDRILPLEAIGPCLARAVLQGAPT
jgi:two-component system, chemotaxis family, protein-glutamate methylesterase/glutaminase